MYSAVAGGVIFIRKCFIFLFEEEFFPSYFLWKFHIFLLHREGNVFLLTVIQNNFMRNPQHEDNLIYTTIRLLLVWNPELLLL